MQIISNNDISHLKDKECLFLFYFTASWCGPCKRICPLIEKLSEGLDSSKVEIFKVDIDDNGELADELKVKSVPTFYLFKQKELLGQCSGANIKNVHALLKQHLN